MGTHRVTVLTPEEYLVFDRKSDIPHEYIFGELVPVTLAAAPSHGHLTFNASYAIGNRLPGEGGGRCRVFVSTLRVCPNPATSFFYPDVVVVCGPLEFTDTHKDTITNPALIVEVLSPSTRNYDLGDKTRLYFKIPSLGDLLLIEQDRIGVEHWRRAANGHWEMEQIEDAGATLRLESVGCEVLVAEIYKGMDWSQEPQ